MKTTVATHFPIAQRAKGGLVLPLALALVVVTLCAFPLAGCSAAADTTMSYAEYQKIENGMSYREVVKIVGCEGKESASSEVDLGFGSVKSVIYTWEGNGSTGSNANVTFQNDAVVTKAQLGLK